MWAETSALVQVSVSLSTNESMPGDPVSLRVKGEKGSCVCLAAVDKSLYLVKPGFQLSIDKVGPSEDLTETTFMFGAVYESGGFQWLSRLSDVPALFRCSGNLLNSTCLMPLGHPRTTDTFGGRDCHRDERGAPQCSPGTGTSPKMPALPSRWVCSCSPSIMKLTLSQMGCVSPLLLLMSNLFKFRQGLIIRYNPPFKANVLMSEIARQQ